MPAMPASGSSGSGGSGFRLSDSQITSISGSISGFAATFAKQPIQRIKWIRQVNSGAVVPYNELFWKTIQADGVTGLFRGSVAGIMRNVPHSALVYTIYPVFEPLVLQQQALGRLPGGDFGLRRSRGGGGGSGGGGDASNSSSSPGDAKSRDARGSGGGSSRSEGGKAAFSTRFWAGYATLFFATLITHPLDTLRVRISVMHGEASTPTMIKQILETGGWRALYQGFSATLVGAGPRGALGFGVFETLKDVSSQSAVLSSLAPTTQKLLFGYVAGLCAETAIYPLDTVRRRQQAFGAGSPLGKHNVVSALMFVFRSEGFMGLFKGLSLNLFKNPIATAVSFSVNDLVKDILSSRRASKA